MYSCELITNLRAKKVLCHRIEVARISGATTTDCVFCNVIGYRRITSGKALSNQLNEDRGIGRRSPDPFSLERGRGLGTRLATARFGVRDFEIQWISGGFLDFRLDFWISNWISGFHSGFLDFKVDFWISRWISGFQSGFLNCKVHF